MKTETANVIMAAFALLNLIATMLILFANFKAVSAMEKQIASTSRPYVFYNLKSSTGRVEAVLKCSGASAAYNVEVSRNPPAKAKLRVPTSSITDRTIPFLAPQSEIREYLGSFEGLKETSPDLQFTVKIKYTDRAGRRYTEDFAIDLDALSKIPQVARPTIEDRLKEIEGSVLELNKTLTRFRETAKERHSNSSQADSSAENSAR